MNAEVVPPFASVIMLKPVALSAHFPEQTCMVMRHEFLKIILETNTACTCGPCNPLLGC